MNINNVFVKPDVIEDCLSECFEASERLSKKNTVITKSSKVVLKTAS